MSINEDGYRLWLRYQKIDNDIRLSQYRKMIDAVTILEIGETYDIIKDELDLALPVILDKKIPIARTMLPGSVLVAGTIEGLKKINLDIPQADRLGMGNEGFLIRHYKDGEYSRIILAGNTAMSVITGVFHFLRLLQTHQDIYDIHFLSSPRIRNRLLCHWDNIDGSIERGYAGRSLWKWGELPDETDPRYRDYARACASIGINGTILNNVNSQAEILSTEYLVKIAALADILRPYGIRVYLSPPFNAPALLGKVNTSDPRSPDIIRWWKEKVDEIYSMIPDFGGFQVKASSEGQPGPQEYGANHHDGANMLAEAMHDHTGIVLWRAFVYDTEIDNDRAKCAYKEFEPLDGKFYPGVFVQVKNGPVDFQPREPFHPLFGAMPKTPLALELQITQEYLGQAVHLVYLAPMWKEVLDADTYARGEGSTVSRIVDGSLFGNSESAIIGVSNTGSDRNWCGHHFAQANWYAFGRLAWDNDLSSEAICEEWVRMTWSNDPVVVESIKTMMLGSWEACVDYMTPLGLHHIMQEGHHYGPDPAFNRASREDWNSVYYHRADKDGLGFDRSSKGSNAAGQYFSPLCEKYGNLETCPEKYLLWFHHVPWNYRFGSGRTLFEEIRHRYDYGVEYVTEMRDAWQRLKGKIDSQRFEHIGKKLEEQEENAKLWRDVCVEYFQQIARTAKMDRNRVEQG
ncbi:MAG: alpha-glucuronidase [Chloroflexi bacterium RBG_13_46_14]|nr:MAG: alpha-glucuronidase [Chloroflexi bacterium RBG_13_46_14]